MTCQQCKREKATVNVFLQWNEKQEEMHLCKRCYETMKQKQLVPSGSFLPFDELLQPSWNLFSTMPRQQTEPHFRGNSVLDRFGRNSTDAARAGLIDPVIGREEEIERVIEILNRRNKNNPVLIGEPGVGKTAIAEGLALRIAEGKSRQNC